MIKITIEVDRKEELDAIVDGYSTASDKRESEGKMLSAEWKIKGLEDEVQKLSNNNKFRSKKNRKVDR